jgi:AcrR family transcriptional regulator
MVTNPSPVKRRRRSRQAAQAEIVSAAEVFLRGRPFRELSVEEVMAGTSLSRSSFYVYFRDRHDLLLRVVEQIGDELFAMADRWLSGGGDPADDVWQALTGVVDVYATHGSVMRAIADASAVDREVETVYHALIQRFIDATAAHIREELAAGRAAPVAEPDDCAFALVWMTERYLSLSLGAPPRRVSNETAVRTLNDIWLRGLYARE